MAKQTFCPPEWQSWAAKVTFSPAVKKGSTIFISGLTSVDYDTGEFVGEGDMATQLRQIFRNMEKALKAAHASLADVVRTTDYITTMQGYKDTAPVRREFFGDSFPAATGVIVAGLLRPKALIEVDAVAMVDE